MVATSNGNILIFYIAVAQETLCLGTKTMSLLEDAKL